ncbi:phosphatidylinositol-specific phospholipase C/glycerophosphodiester phosphodiesterase family protein [Anaerostipes sp.]|uniref:phosphatidylinositol-specific phospholipase C/glycerophosphodiester phosphodiesterase family protein n=1 Tax=Anaerostipes sp. TaxID=1872530 RepID=UPI003FF0CDC8
MSYKNLIKQISMKQKIFFRFLFSILIILILTGLTLHHKNEVRQKRIQKQREATAAAKRDLAQIRRENQIDSSLKPWYSYHGIAHALGGVDEKKYLNSVDGFYEAYRKGYHIFEMDMLLTTDRVVIGKHKWGSNLADPLTKKGKPVSSQRFLNTKIYGKYKPTTLSDVLKLMEKYPDFYLMTDSKDDKPGKVQQDFTTIVDTVKKAGKESLLDRFIVQVYNEEMYQTIEKIYPFKHVLYTTYKQPDASFYKMIQFCKANHIEGVTNPQDDINDYRMDLLKKAGLVSYTHSVNDSYQAKEYMALGVYGIYSDFLIPAKIDYAWVRANFSPFAKEFIQYTVPAYRNL